MPVKPNVVSQLDSQFGMGRQGGMMSKGLAPNVLKDTKGAKFSTMENSLLKGLTPDPKSLSGSISGKQFYTQASGGDMSKPPAVRSKKFYKPKIK